MELKEITEEEFCLFCEGHPLMTFHQTKEWGELKKKNGWDYVFVGLYDHDTLVGASLLLSKMTPIRKKIFYAPRGFLLDFSNLELVSSFTEEVKKYVKSHGGIFFKIDPYVEAIERDRDGKVVEGGFDNTKIREYLSSLGYKRQHASVLEQTLQPSFMYTIDLKGKTIDDVMKEMDSKTRQMIRKNEKNGVVVRDGGREDVKIFSDVMAHTSSRRGFLPRPYAYHLNMFDTFSKNGKFSLQIAEVHPREQIALLESEKGALEKELSEKKTLHDKGELKMKEEKYLSRIKEGEESIARIDKQIVEMRELLENHGEIIPLGAINYMLYGGEVLSFYGGAYEDFLQFQPFYSIHYKMICYAIEHGYDTYNFYGISGNIVKDDPMYGVYLFKRGFGGQVVELIGEYDYPVSKFWYFVYQFSYDLVHQLKHFKMKLFSRK